MRIKTNQIIGPYLITLLVLLVLEVLSSSFLPILGLQNYKLPFSILLVLYVSFKLETPYLALLILGLQFMHSYFSIEGWEMGACAGVLISILVSYMRDLIDLNSKFTTVIFTFIFQAVWFLLTSIMLYMKMGDFPFILQKFSRFFVEASCGALIAPFLFSFFDKVWATKDTSLGAQG